MSSNRAFKPKGSAAYNLKRDRAVSLSGEIFPFTVGNTKEMKAALQAAQDSSQAHLDLMVTQAQRPLTKTEKATGRFDDPNNDKSMPRSLKNPKPPAENPARIVADSLAESNPRGWDAQGQHAGRLRHFEKLAAMKEQQLIEQKLNAEFWARDDVKAAVKHSGSLLESLKRNPAATPSQIQEAERLYGLVSKGELEPDTYFDMAEQAGLMREPKPRAPVGVEEPIEKLIAAPRNTTGRDGQQ